jgi:hypothetical protein
MAVSTIGRDLPPRVTSIHGGCDCCGCAPPRLFAIKVRSRRNAAVTRTLRLCARCVEGEDRVWRLTWERER